MKYEKLGRSSLTVSRLCLGTMQFGARTSAKDSAIIIDKARAAGINFIDTADAYNDGRSEEITGSAVRAHRLDWIVATKLGNGPFEPPNRRGSSRHWIFEACEASLKRLGLDHIDIYYLHREDLDTDMVETVRALGDLIRSGKIRYFGISNFRSWRIAEICNICDKLNIDRPIVSQPYYNALNRMPEVEHLPACGHYGLGVFPYSPMARGVLTAKYQPGAAPAADSRAGVGDARMMASEWREESLVIAAKIKDHAEARGITPGRFAVAWVLANRFATGTIVGPRTLEHLDGALGAEDYQFSAEDEAFVDALVPIGHPSTPGYSDPEYPIEGRILRV